MADCTTFSDCICIVCVSGAINCADCKVRECVALNQ